MKAFIDEHREVYGVSRSAVGPPSATPLPLARATGSGFVYVAFVIDAFAHRIVGWRASRSARAELDARCSMLSSKLSMTGSPGKPTSFTTAI
ncbi:hypothetical protein MicloDRAFT_00004750 [Microvirga lotononidis]|uniref:Integrase catalytic domain-containing protein n=1 Tax=Microvirga lotononidis TaxID=864069 RepID=I4Z404_9HYPH|nr:hypothetical protein MicloDRAFT_00004750 [Microvirga lotononidis]